MLGNLLKKYSNTLSKPTLAIIQSDTDLFAAQNDIEIDMDDNNALSPQAQARRERVLAMDNQSCIFSGNVVSTASNILVRSTSCVETFG